MNKELKKAIKSCVLNNEFKKETDYIKRWYIIQRILLLIPILLITLNIYTTGGLYYYMSLSMTSVLSFGYYGWNYLDTTFTTTKIYKYTNRILNNYEIKEYNITIKIKELYKQYGMDYEL